METKKVLEILNNICNTLIENSELLTELDRKIGDGDHGINVKRGFTEIQKNLPSYEGKTIKEIFNSIGMTLMTKVGGSSGPLFATAFMKASKEENFGAMLESATQGIEARGKAVCGEKTMVDVLRPSCEVYKESMLKGLSHKEAMQEVVNVAKERLEFTKTIAATKGRASYLGERSIGVYDPGAYTVYLVLTEIAKAGE